MTTKDLQCEIITLMNRLGWSKKQLARIIYHEREEHDDAKQIKRFEESFRKELDRPTTKPEKLQEYLQIIYRQREYKNLDLVVPVYRGKKVLSPTMQEGLKKLSRDISRSIDQD